MSYRKKGIILRFCEFMCGSLSMLFWVLLIFGFEEGYVAIATLLSALIHEMGHIVFLHFSRNSRASLRAVESGFRIKSANMLDYKSQRWLYLSGSMANILTASFCLILSLVFGGFFVFFSIINLATAFSNLLPIEGYDGYGAIKTYVEEKEFPCSFLRALSTLSTSLVFILTVLSLYLMDRLDGGYWIFAIFSFTMIKHMENGLSSYRARF